MIRLIITLLIITLSCPVFAQGKVSRNTNSTSKTTNTLTHKTSKSDATGSINGHEYIDLGLPSGLKWATCNVGASKPSGYGEYYAWGETSPKSNYSWNTYADYDHEEGRNVYFKRFSYWDKKERQIPPESGYDVARLKWGGSWRTPTYQEIKELQNHCTWNCTTISGVPGWKITGPSGKSIFLPFAGEKKGTEVDGKNEWGYYWTSTLGEYSYDGNAESIAGYWRGVTGSIGPRYIGASIRPVSN